MTKRISVGLLLAVAISLSLPLAAGAAPFGPAAELVTNGGFEAGSVGWSQSSTTGSNLISDFWVRSGDWGAWLAGKNNTQDRLSQKIAIPAGVSARLRFWWSLRTEENGTAFDTLKVNVLNNSGGLLENIATLDNALLGDYEWELRTYDLSAYAGQTVQLQFVGQTDATNVTDFWVDEVSVQTGPPMKRSYLPLVRK